MNKGLRGEICFSSEEEEKEKKALLFLRASDLGENEEMNDFSQDLTCSLAHHHHHHHPKTVYDASRGSQRHT